MSFAGDLSLPADKADFLDDGHMSKFYFRQVSCIKPVMNLVLKCLYSCTNIQNKLAMPALAIGLLLYMLLSSCQSGMLETYKLLIQGEISTRSNLQKAIPVKDGFQLAIL